MGSKKKVPGIPSSSLADIAFLLLIFFLVSTTMDVDSGLERKLPPMPPEEQEDTPPIKERNVFVVLVNAKNQLLVEGELTRVEDLRDKAKNFMANPDDDATLPEKKMVDVPYFGEVPVTKGIISLRNDVGTQYKMYIAVQNELVGAINDLREDLSKQKFGRSFNSLNLEHKKAIQEIYQSRISEAEPKRVGDK